MSERVSEEMLRTWARVLTPGQAALCEELLLAREVIAAARELDEVRLRFLVPSEEETEAAARLALAIQRYDEGSE